MAYFMPSSVLKRLLRYVLVKLDFLEQDDLDLDSVDIALGRITTLEWRDVRLNTKAGPIFCIKIFAS